MDQRRNNVKDRGRGKRGEKRDEKEKQEKRDVERDERFMTEILGTNTN